MVTTNVVFPARADRHTVIHVGDRICQFRIEKHQPQLFFESVDTLGNADRGGIGFYWEAVSDVPQSKVVCLNKEG